MKGWRTFGVNIAIAVFGVMEATDWTALLGSDAAGWTVTAIAIANMALRTVTTTRLGQRA
jgi:hypothetical protein